MAYPLEPEPPATPDPGRTREAEPVDQEHAPGSAGEAGISPEQLARVVRRLETGFYDRAEIREQVARRILDEPDQ
jgi:hypothetical protein